MPKEGHVQVRSFSSEDNPTQKDLEKFDKIVNKFLEEIFRPSKEGAEQSKTLQSITTLSVGNKIVTTIWYFDMVTKPTVTTLK